MRQSKLFAMSLLSTDTAHRALMRVMRHHAPRSDLSTHTVANQSEPLVGVNWYADDAMLNVEVQLYVGKVKGLFSDQHRCLTVTGYT